MPYSTQFIAGTPTPSTPLEYIVPELYVAVIRDVEVWLSSGAPLTVYVAAVKPGPLTVAISVFDVTGGATSQQWKGRAVLNAGDTLEAAVSAGAATVLVSGYLLSAP